MMFALLSGSFMLGVMTGEICPSEVREVPERNETIVFKCTPPGHKLPMAKDPARIFTPEPKQEVLTRLAEIPQAKKNPYKKKTKKRSKRSKRR